jgi:hypothetical protein
MEDEKDTGKHYRYTYAGVKLDPARIAKVYGINNILQGSILKKVLCAGDRGHNETIDDINDIICAAERWKEMILEDKELENK